jgi:hypothetical protein
LVACHRNEDRSQVPGVKYALGWGNR